MPVIISMSLAIFIWALYPLAAVLCLKSMNSLELIILSTFISAGGISIISFIYLFKTNNLKKAIDLSKSFTKSNYVSIFISGATNILCHSLFFIALTMSHQGGVSILYESWPIIALIATPFLMKRAWKEVSLKEFLISLLALVGVIIVILSDDNIQLPFFSNTKNLNEETDYMALLGYIIALVGAYSCAIAVVTKAVVTELHSELKDMTASTIISEFYSRVISLALLILVLPFIYSYVDLSNVNWIPVLFIGLFVMVMGGMFYTYSLVNSTNPTIHILYYFVPLLAVILLWNAGESSIGIGLFIGGGIITACNVYLYFAGRKAEFEQPL